MSSNLRRINTQTHNCYISKLTIQDKKSIGVLNYGSCFDDKLFMFSPNTILFQKHTNKTRNHFMCTYIGAYYCRRTFSWQEKQQQYLRTEKGAINCVIYFRTTHLLCNVCFRKQTYYLNIGWLTQSNQYVYIYLV